jgi:hypothetical protein
MATEAPTMAALAGLWRRVLIAWPNGRRDETTMVHWLQGPSLYADLRQPADRPGFRAITCLRHLNPEHVAWLARQEGFAGVLRFDGSAFEWQRPIDFQPRSLHADAGRLWFEGALLIEQGRDVAYTEHWQRESPAGQPCAAARLRDMDTGCAGFVIRVGVTFMIARGRSAALPPHHTLGDLVVGAACLQDAQDIVDCEISLGRVDRSGWLVEHSSLPFKEGWRPSPRRPPRTDRVIDMRDLQADGRPYERRREVMDVEGSLEDLLSPIVADHSLSQVLP